VTCDMNGGGLRSPVAGAHWGCSFCFPFGGGREGIRELAAGGGVWAWLGSVREYCGAKQRATWSASSADRYLGSGCNG